MKKLKLGKFKDNMPKVLIAFVVLILFMLTYVTVKEVFNKSKLDIEIEELNAEIEGLQLKKDGFLGLLDTYEDRFYIEKEARTKLNMKKPGEIVIVVRLDQVNNLDKSNIDSQLFDENGEVVLEKNNPALWWDYFFTRNVNK